jgi:hypothetical protein
LEEVHTAPEDSARTKHLMYVANRPDDGKDSLLPEGEMLFHTDQCYYKILVKITWHYAMEVPGVGGNRWF